MWGGHHEYIRRCSVHRRDTMSTSGGYHEYIGGCSVHRRDIMIHVGEQLDKILSISIESSDVLNIPPMYSWYLPDVLMVSPDVFMVAPRCTEHPRCTHGIPPMYSWDPPDVLMVSPWCTEHPPPSMYWTHIIQGEIWNEFSCKILELVWRNITLLSFVLPFSFQDFRDGWGQLFR